MTPTTAALGRAILNLEREAGKMHIEASFARSNGDAEYARFFLSRESQAREDAKTLESLMDLERERAEWKRRFADAVERMEGKLHCADGCKCSARLEVNQLRALLQPLPPP